MKRFDFIIIGSGFAGLACAFILSKRGYKVGVFEKHHHVGGCLQTFKRSGIIFDTGVHYIGSLDEGQLLHRIFKYLGLFENIGYHKLDSTGFENITMAGQNYKYAMGYENFEDTLSSYFPRERSHIATYIDDLRKTSLTFPSKFTHEDFSSNYSTILSYFTGIGQYLDKLTSNERLKNVLSATNMLYAGSRDKSPFFLHAHINNSYIQSAYRVIGGSHIIADSLASSIRNMGGEIFTRSAVTKIGCNTTHATSVTTENGEVYEAKVFISNIHPSSIIEMIDPSMFRKAYRDRIRGLNNTISHFSVYIKFKPNTVPYSNCNYYNFKDNDVWGCSSYTQADWPRGYLYMHQVSRQNIEYAESAIMIAYMNFNEVERWINTTIEHRGDDYVQFKEQKQEVMLGLLERDYPGIRQHMQSVYSSSPLTQRDYTGSPRGSMYGIEKDKNYPKQTFLSHKTKIPNLFFTGQNTNAHGILGVAISAIITTEEFAGTESIISEIL